MNHLKNEKSLYLKQHRHNPVDWHPWGKAAFELAQEKNLPIFLSIGYSACHWCHVMEKESFEDTQVSDLLNQNFISIKVDREEWPEVDDYYMQAVQAMTGRGGWPLSAFLDSAGKIFYGGTYWPKHHFIRLLEEVHQSWINKKGDIEKSTQSIAISLKSNVTGNNNKNISSLNGTFLSLTIERFDNQWGGHQGAPKFPHSYEWKLLSHLGRWDLAQKSLLNMARGGIYDHLGGGFHRYSTDEHWGVPHFEKMLYDQATICDATVDCLIQIRHAKESGEEVSWTDEDLQLEAILKHTLSYVLSDLQSRDGGFYSSEDADSEGDEGKYYLWSSDEIAEILQNNFLNWQGDFPLNSLSFFEKKHLLRLSPSGNFAKIHAEQQDSIKLLTEKRSKREKPARDEKILCSWNGLMIISLLKAHRWTGESEYLSAADKAITFLKTHLWKNQQLLRRYCEGESKHNASLEDYAFLISALLELYQSTGNSEHLDWAKHLQEQQEDHFFDSSSLLYFSSDKESLVPNRRHAFVDNVTPSAIAVSLGNLWKLAYLSSNEKYLNRAEEVWGALPEWIEKLPTAFSLSLYQANHYAEKKPRIIKLSHSNYSENFEKISKQLSTGDLVCPDEQLKGNAWQICTWLSCTQDGLETEKLIEALKSKNIRA